MVMCSVFCPRPLTAGILYSLHNEYLILNVDHLLRMASAGKWTMDYF